ncbi:hypothetical protein [Natronorubrum thiooxidans]|uniref:Uncharacterized protein n=1 Tax=Natronorubrum thiooxidans TaxID=308853 RepID=A0A1N7HAN8_9EURY|nr:hypothetical protein [Natronorubrum thiooxidans]SIS21718.1 hypothetical protein SAMN05421752_1403 [Natronorubrum thiooxidans]
MTVNAHNPGDSRFQCDDDILEAAPENPVRFLSRPNWVWEAMIDGITDLDRLEAYRQAEKRHINRSADKAVAHKYIDARERELTGTSPETTVDIETTADVDTTTSPTTNATTNPITATDGGETVPQTDTTADTVEDRANELHPDVSGLEAGEVLVVDRDEHTVCIWPATPDADEPFILREIADGDDHVETLSQSACFERIRSFDPERRSAVELEHDAPATAAL